LDVVHNLRHSARLALIQVKGAAAQTFGPQTFA
jgi:hypothetical protein